MNNHLFPACCGIATKRQTLYLNHIHIFFDILYLKTLQPGLSNSPTLPGVLFKALRCGVSISWRDDGPHPSMKEAHVILYIIADETGYDK